MDSYEEEKKVKSGNNSVCTDSSKVVRKVKEGNGTVQYINNSGGVVIIGQMIRHDQIQIDVGATRGDVVVQQIDFSKILHIS